MSSGMRSLSPRRNSTSATTVAELVHEQLGHFGLTAQSEFGQTLGRIAGRLYDNQVDTEHNARLRDELMSLGRPAPLFTIDFEPAGLSRATFQRFFDCLAPTFDHMNIQR
ncbi:MAG: hypothetical protein KDA60_20060 [Planctomycetales bacterium]|nr:hypothetical protein [Planctomycetales bacterium]